MAMRSVCGKKLIIVLTAFFFGSCVPANNATTNPPFTVESTSTSYISQGNELPAQIIERCLSPEETTLGDLTLSGKLIVSEKGEYYSISLPGYSRGPLQKEIEPISVSPNHLRIILLQRIDYFTNSHLIIMDSQGKTIRSFDWRKDWKLPVRWLDNERVAVSTPPVGSIVILSVSSGVEEKITFPYSSEVYVEEGLAKIRSGFVSYDPTLNKVIYEGLGHVFILRDNEILPGTTIWARRNFANWADPVWSPMGDQIAVPLSNDTNIDDLYLIGTFGEENRFTDFYKAYKHPASTLIYGLSWSPDDEHLAIQLDLRIGKNDNPQKIENQLAGRLLVAEVYGRRLTDYCMIFAYPPVWSPDGKYLAVDHVLVDLENERAYKVTDGYIIGWLADEQ
jgi:WD40 repeat protein